MWREPATTALQKDVSLEKNLFFQGKKGNQRKFKIKKEASSCLKWSFIVIDVSFIVLEKQKNANKHWQGCCKYADIGWSTIAIGLLAIVSTIQESDETDDNLWLVSWYTCSFAQQEKDYVPVRQSDVQGHQESCLPKFCISNEKEFHLQAASNCAWQKSFWELRLELDGFLLNIRWIHVWWSREQTSNYWIDYP